ncbi:hypothetical protein [Xanthobacter sp. KR7-225]|uniref:hypothetical protein n=1 Tax=Xanthobacter sp. KR7-225 TaxID=3156613 RepID=UPI0032B359B9
MTAPHSARFDAERFRKVAVLIELGATEGERSAARARAEAIAMVAGMTLDDALDGMRAEAATAPPQDDWRDGFRDMMRDLERERWDRDAPARAAALREFGSREAMFAETDRERLLADEFANIRWDHANEDAPHAAREAARRAFPMPDDLAGVCAEWRGWRTIWTRRRLFDSRYEFPLGVSARWDCLEWMLDNWSDPSFAGIEARTLWLRFWETEGGGRGWGTDKALAALLLDISMMQMPTASDDGTGKNCHPSTTAPAERRTNAQKRAEVLAMLTAHPELSDGEISRRCGVSRQNVSNHRKAIGRERTRS